MEIPTAYELAISEINKKIKNDEVKIVKSRNLVAKLIDNNRNQLKWSANFYIHPAVIAELRAKGYKVRDTGIDRGVQIADSWEITR